MVYAGAAVYDSTFEGNTAVRNGGALYGADAPSIARSTFLGNSAASGGAVYLGLRGSVRECAFRNNSAHQGGALYLQTDPGFDTPLELQNSIFADNFAQEGGGFFSLDHEANIVSCAFLRNTALESGGGVQLSGEAFSILSSSILWQHVAPLGGDIHAGTTPCAVRHCNVSDVRYHGVDGSLSADPLFANADPSAGVLDLRLLPGSPCIDAGYDPDTPSTDMDGNERFDDPETENCEEPASVECNWFSDIGPFEYQGQEGS